MRIDRNKKRKRGSTRGVAARVHHGEEQREARGELASFRAGTKNGDSAKEIYRSVLYTYDQTILDAVVYDMTPFLPDHPGGKRLPLKYAGRDATAAWDSIHGHKKAQILEQWSYLRVGVVAADAGPPPAPEKSRRSKL